MTLLTATSARSSAIFLPRRPAGSDLTCFPDRSPPSRLPSSTPAPRAASQPTVAAPASPPRQRTNREAGRQSLQQTRASGKRPLRREAEPGEEGTGASGRGRGRELGERSCGGGRRPKHFFPRSPRGSAPSPRSPPFTFPLESGESRSACVPEPLIPQASPFSPRAYSSSPPRSHLCVPSGPSSPASASTFPASLRPYLLSTRPLVPS